MENKEMVDFTKKLDEAYSRGFNKGLEMGIFFMEESNKRIIVSIDMFMRNTVSDLEKKFNLVKKENEGNI